MFKDKVLLITGGTGSFGNAVLKKMLLSDIKEIRIFSRDEKKQHDMRVELASDKVKFYIGDVRDINSINAAMNGVDYVFHAAALKQVPSCEFFPIEAVKTNVFGTENVLESAIRFKVKRVICLSTDKAVYPINSMGMTKGVMEKVAIAKSRSVTDTVITITRYGNVLASRGSVIPHFVEQMRKGMDLTVTDPNMTRFIMTLEEAVDLVLFAFEHGQAGDIFVQKAPAATIETLANTLLEIYKSNLKVRVIGTRHGEKLYESLLTREEFAHAEDMNTHYRIKADNRDLNYSKYFEQGDRQVDQMEEYHSHNTYRLSNMELKDILLKLDFVQETLNSIQ
ncbi:MAG: polysaccharide biosynthesis protein [Chitinophagaceae bacterium]|nr:polysaccharide biosynthesis protein [Chitinophagaceae bacterium]MCA6459656.1 polysaccharide biosynthesis protein [Chitinophagaceae bacterium]MCA6464523.1 polysaccharide biosynthesis protein [Chitinophagaceae bacterium]